MGNNISVSYLKSWLTSVFCDTSHPDKPIDKTLVISTLVATVASYFLGFGVAGLAVAAGYKHAQSRERKSIVPIPMPVFQPIVKETPLKAPEPAAAPIEAPQAPAPSTTQQTAAPVSKEIKSEPAPQPTASQQTVSAPVSTRVVTPVKIQLTPPPAQASAAPLELVTAKPMVATLRATSEVAARTVSTNLRGQLMPQSVSPLPDEHDDGALNIGAFLNKRSQSEQLPKTNKSRPPGKPEKSNSGPVGIRNAGYSCFASSALQLIVHSPLDPSLSDLVSRQHKEKGATLAKLVNGYKDQGASEVPFDIKKLYDLIPESNGNAGAALQQDASELLVGILGLISKSLDRGRPLDDQIGENWDLFNHDMTVLKTLRKTYKVPENAVNLGRDTFLVRTGPTSAYSDEYSIEVPLVQLNVKWNQNVPRALLPLTDLLKEVFSGRDVTSKDADPYRLPDGKFANPVKEQVLFNKTPEVLFISLNRQEYVAEPRTEIMEVMIDNEKIPTKIPMVIPAGARPIPDAIEVPSKLPWGTKDQLELKGFIRYFGTGDKGHYVTYVKNSDKYFCLNDDKVALISAQEFAKNQAFSYVLLYSKRK